MLHGKKIKYVSVARKSPLLRKKSKLHSPTIVEVRFSTFNYKPYNISYPIVKTEQIWPLRWFYIFKKIKEILIRSKKLKLI